MGLQLALTGLGNVAIQSVKNKWFFCTVKHWKDLPVREGAAPSLPFHLRRLTPVRAVRFLASRTTQLVEFVREFVRDNITR
jgi:hypothetical protein